MYDFVLNGAIFDGISNIYMLSTATLFLAVIIALYCANFLKDDRRENVEAEVEEMLDASENEQSSTRHQKTQQQPTENSETDSDEEEALADGLVGKLKTARIKELEAQLTRDQLEEERRIEREQLAAIFELLKKQEAELNMQEIDECELAAQLNLYR